MSTYSGQCSAVGSFEYADNFKLYVELTETEKNVEKNTSKIKYNVYCKSSGAGSINAQHLKYFKLNGTEIINSTVSVNVVSPNANISIASGTTSAISHNSDGSKSVSFEAQIKASSYGVSASLSDTFKLSTIPRASSISCSSADIESNATIKITSASSSFTHKVTAIFGSETTTIATNKAGGSFSWTIPTSYYAQIPNKKSETATITCETFSGSTSIGKKTCTCTITANESKCKPIVSATVVDTNATTIALTGSSSKLVKYKSTAKVTITATAKNSASISSKKVNDTSTSGDTISFSNVSTNLFKVIVTDSRGYSTTVTVMPAIVNYVSLSINATIKRPAPTTGEISLKFTGNYFNGNFGTADNTLSVNWYYKLKTDSTWISGGAIMPTISGNTYSSGATEISLGTNFNYLEDYDFYLEVKDKLTTIKPKYLVSRGVPVFNWGKNFFYINVKTTYNTDGLHSPQNVGVYLDEYGNIRTKQLMTSGNWSVQNNDIVLLKLDFSNNRMSTTGDIYTEEVNSKNIIPRETEVYNVGTGNWRWNDAYIKYLNASGNIDCAGNMNLGGNLKNQYTYDNTTTASANTYISSSYNFRRSTSSSIKYKENITEEFEERLKPERLYDLTVVQFNYKDNHISKDDKRYGENFIGFIAEDVKKIYEPAVEYNEDGTVEMWNYKVMIPAMLKLIQEQHQVQLEQQTIIEQLQDEIKELKGNRKMINEQLTRKESEVV